MIRHEDTKERRDYVLWSFVPSWLHSKMTTTTTRRLLKNKTISAERVERLLNSDQFVLNCLVAPVLEPGSQLGFQQLAGRRVGQFRHEDDVFGQLPLREPTGQKAAQLECCRGLPGPQHDHRQGRSSHFVSGMAMTAASATAGWATRAFSMSTELIHSPPDLIRSLIRSVIFR